MSGGVYTATQAHIDFMVKVYAMFYVSNPLHPDVWPSVRRMEAEVVRMTASLFHGGPSVCGTMTSGGTESILNALKTYREWARATKPHVGTPEILAPTTAHAAFLKGCHLMNMKYVMVEVDEDTQQVNVGAMRRAITSNTIALVGSACTFPHGVVDNIPALASLAREHGLGLHVDCCLGGYVLPFLKKLGRPMPDFDFALDGVTSISCDTHKYGLTPKGTSVLLFSSPELRRHMYFKCTDWPGGLYASPTIPGSRPGALVAASWAALLSIGFDGYVKIATEIATAMDKLQAALAKLPGCKIFGPPHGPCVAWTSTAYNIYRMGELMSNRGYHLNSLHRPASIHIAFTDANCHTVDQLIADLQIVDAQLRSDPEAGNSGFAPLYGGVFPGIWCRWIVCVVAVQSVVIVMVVSNGALLLDATALTE